MTKNLILIIAFFGLSNVLFAQEETKVKTYNFSQFQKEILNADHSDTLLAINFWATWCGPCVKELPYFEEVNESYKNRKLRVILVSLDFEDKYESKLIPFLEDKGIKSEVIWLNDTKYNTWIDQVSKEWSGAIPATVFIKNGKVIKFMEKELELEELKQTINTLL